MHGVHAQVSGLVIRSRSGLELPRLPGLTFYIGVKSCSVSKSNAGYLFLIE